MRVLPLILGVLLVSYSVIELWLVPPASAIEQIESPYCRYWLCSPVVEVERDYQYFLQAGSEQAPKSIRALLDLLDRDPAQAFRWCDLGDVLFESGRTKDAGYCFSRALALGPNSAPVLLRAANFFYQVEDHAGALRLTRQLLSQVSDYDPILFSNLDRLGIPIDEVLGSAMPLDKRAAQSYLRHFLGTPRVEEGRQVWLWVSDHHFADDKLAAEYLAFLLRNHAYESAAQAWEHYLGSKRGDYRATNSLFDGGFESQPTESPLDWQFAPLETVQVSRDETVAHDGHASLKIQFSATDNVAFQQVTQFAVVHPGTYRLQFWVKADGLTTNEGIRLRVTDAENAGRLDVLTDNRTGSFGWEHEEKVFVVPASTRLVKVQVVRLASNKFDNKIGGTAWIDSVKLVPVTAGKA
jgi:hypothetical protein